MAKLTPTELQQAKAEAAYRRLVAQAKTRLNVAVTCTEQAAELLRDVDQPRPAATLERLAGELAAVLPKIKTSKGG